MEANQINRTMLVLANHVPRAPAELVEKMVRTVKALNQQRAAEEKAPERSPAEPARTTDVKRHKRTL